MSAAFSAGAMQSEHEAENTAIDEGGKRSEAADLAQAKANT